MLNLELELTVLVFAGLLALAALRQLRGKPTDDVQANPGSWLSRGVPMLES